MDCSFLIDNVIITFHYRTKVWISRKFYCREVAKFSMDLVSSGEPTRFQKSKYDPTKSFLSGPSSQIPAWDPVIGILRALNGADATAKAKYDPAAAALEGLKQLNESDFNVAPKWDPIFGLQNAAHDPTPPKSSR